MTLSFPKVYTDERVANMLLGKARKAHTDAKLELARKTGGWQIVDATPVEIPLPVVDTTPPAIIMGYDLGTKDSAVLAMVQNGEVTHVDMEVQGAVTGYATNKDIVLDSYAKVDVAVAEMVSAVMKKGKSKVAPKVAYAKEVTGEVQVVLPLVSVFPKSLLVVHEGKHTWVSREKITGFKVDGSNVNLYMTKKFAQQRKFPIAA